MSPGPCALPTGKGGCDMTGTKLYRYSLAHARERDELDLFRQNEQANKSCAKAIDAAIRESNYKLFHYDLAAAAEAVLSEHGAERVQWVLACVLEQNKWDGRYSENSKEWARGFDLPEPTRPLALDTHPSVLDSFIMRVREAAVTQALKLEPPGDTPGGYKYYATERPLDAGGIPKKPKPERVVNFDCRRYVEDHAFSAWGCVHYREPLSKRQLTRYGLRASAANPQERASVVGSLKNRQEQEPKQAQPERRRKGEPEI